MKDIKIIGVLVLTLITSCTNYNLNNDDLKWQPYLINDILVFKSNNNSIDSIRVNLIQFHMNPEDQLSFLSPIHESIFVSGELLNPPIEMRHLRHVSLLKIYADKGDTQINFELEKSSDTLIYASGHYLKNQLNKFNVRDKIINNNCFEDILQLYPNYTGGLNYEFDLDSYLWSKKYGYIKYTFKNNKSYELTKLIRKGVNILPKCESK
ncbi:hypothetical protein [Maribacter aquivivus]|nr:hypothetical protein [Maribacter aquivivus]